MTNRSPTLKDVSRLAGVSVSTASRTIAGKPDVSEDSRSKVLAAVEKLGYRPSLLARGLVGGRTSTLGLLVSDIRNPFYPQLALAIEDVANANGYVVLLCNTCDVYRRTQEYIRRLADRKVDGVIHASVASDEDLLQSLINMGTPLMIVNRQPDDTVGFDLVVADNFGGARLAARHLIELGHREIALIAGPAFASVSQERLNGFQEELRGAGVEIPETMIRRGDFTRQSGHQVALDLLSRRLHPTAIFAVNDVVALGVLDAALELGFRIPEDLSVIGFDNIEPAGLGPLRLTTVSAPIKEMGRIACERLLDAISNPETHKLQKILLGTQLVVRDTTASAPLLGPGG